MLHHVAPCCSDLPCSCSPRSTPTNIISPRRAAAELRRGSPALIFFSAIVPDRRGSSRELPRGANSFARRRCACRWSRWAVAIAERRRTRASHDVDRPRTRRDHARGATRQRERSRRHRWRSCRRSLLRGDVLSYQSGVAFSAASNCEPPRGSRFSLKRPGAGAGPQGRTAAFPPGRPAMVFVRDVAAICSSTSAPWPPKHPTSPIQRSAADPLLIDHATGLSSRRRSRYGPRCFAGLCARRFSLPGGGCRTARVAPPARHRPHAVGERSGTCCNPSLEPAAGADEAR